MTTGRRDVRGDLLIERLNAALAEEVWKVPVYAIEQHGVAANPCLLQVRTGHGAHTKPMVRAGDIVRCIGFSEPEFHHEPRVEALCELSAQGSSLAETHEDQVVCSFDVVSHGRAALCFADVDARSQCAGQPWPVTGESIVFVEPERKSHRR